MYLVHDVRSEVFGVLARFFSHQPTVVVAVEQLEVALLRFHRLKRRLFNIPLRLLLWLGFENRTY